MKVYVLTIGDENHGEIFVRGVRKTPESAKALAEKIYQEIWDEIRGLDQVDAVLEEGWSLTLEWNKTGKYENGNWWATFESDTARIYETEMEE